MSNIFKSVKSAISTRTAAEFYGFHVNRNGMMCCPFHDDKHPSMKVDDRYYCFGCQETGDVIDFVSKVFKIPPYEAAKKLAQDFSIDLKNSEPLSEYEKGKMKYDYNDWKERNLEDRCAAILINYECLMRAWMWKYHPDPRNPDAPWDERFVWACKAIPSLSMYIDQLYSPCRDVRERVVDALYGMDIIEQYEGILEMHKEDLVGVYDDHDYTPIDDDDDDAA